MAAALLATDPAGLGGIVIRGAHGPLRDAWLAAIRAALPAGAAWSRLPADAPDSRVLGGIDIAATLAAGAPCVERGVLARADGGAVVLPMAERLSRGAAARLCAVLDSGEVAIERDGLADRWPSRIVLLALDEGEEDERLPGSLADRLAFHLLLDERAAPPAPPDRQAIAAARASAGRVRAPEAALRAFCAATLALGIGSPRAPILALRAARAAAALAGREEIAEPDVALAARLVLAPRATQAPASPDQAETAAETPPPADASETDGHATDELTELVVETARAALPARLLAGLAAEARGVARDGAGRAGAPRPDGGRGRMLGVRQGRRRDGARIALIETLRAAAPWQTIRRAAAPQATRPVLIMPQDLRLRRHEARSGTLTIFAVDASGSSALHRLAEAKGAVELLLGECYARRDRVALIAFRGRGAETLLAPTHALARARRSLAALPGGGATPLAAALEAARDLAAAERRQGRSPLLVVMTDGRPNVARDGSIGRMAAEADALAMAGLLRAERLPGLVIDTGARPQPFTRDLAAAMGARHLPLPRADAAGLSGAVAAARTA